MIQFKQKNIKYKELVLGPYADEKTVSLKETTTKLSKELVKYLNKHKNYQLISYTVLHDNSNSYYDWCISAVVIDHEKENNDNIETKNKKRKKQ